MPTRRKEKPNSKYRLNLLVRFALSCALLGMAVSACGASKSALKKDIETLEQELARLKTERTNLEARSAALDDRVLVYKKKLKRCEQGDKKLRLEVVKISSETTNEPREMEYETIEEEVAVISDGEERPKLTLSGYSPRVSSPSPATTYPPEASGDFKELAADNLGVVNMETDLKMEGFKTSYRDYSNKNYEKALKGFSDFIRDNPSHNYADNAIFWRAECYFALGKFFKAIGEFERLMTRYPNSEMVPSSIYRIGFTYDKLADKQRALEHYFRVVDNYPGTDAARRASRRVSAIEGNIERGTVPTAAKGY